MIGGGVECGPNAVLAFKRRRLPHPRCRVSATCWSLRAIRLLENEPPVLARPELHEMYRSFESSCVLALACCGS